jgi:mannitol/fructose-specific phosphotransferase system IIA component (Ntr-type)
MGLPVSRIIEVVESGGVLVGPSFGSFDDAMSALVDHLVENRCLPAELRDEAVAAVCEREAISSTAIVEIGVSIPHARLAGVSSVVAAMAVSPRAVYYAMAEVPIHIVIVVFSPPELAGDHLNMLAGLSLLLQSDDVRRALRGAPDPRVAIATLGSGSRAAP